MKILSPSLSLVLLVSAMSSTMSSGVVLYSGFQNITISNSFTSVYVDVDGFSSSSSQASGWDVDTFFGGEAFGNSAAFQPVRLTTANNSAIVSLTVGEQVDGFDTYANVAAGSSTHVGSALNQFASGTQGYLGFRLTDNNAAGPYYGWMRVNFSNTGGLGAILDWAYETSGESITVGTIPEPTSYTLLGLGSIFLACRRRKA
jgi:hypothetical protein